MKHESTAAEILKLVGGEKNVDSVTHCATRLRFNLKDEKVANDEALKMYKVLWVLPAAVGSIRSLLVTR